MGHREYNSKHRHSTAETCTDNKTAVHVYASRVPCVREAFSHMHMKGSVEKGDKHF